MPISILNEADIRVAKPSIPWKALLAAYRPQFEKVSLLVRLLDPQLILPADGIL